VADLFAALAGDVELLDGVLHRNFIVDDVFAAVAPFPFLRQDTHPTGRQVGDVFRCRQFIHGNNNFGRVAAGGVTVLAHADRVPRWQALDVRGEEVFTVDRDTHLEQGTHDDAVGSLAARTIFGGNHEGEVVYIPAFIRGLRL